MPINSGCLLNCGHVFAGYSLNSFLIRDEWFWNVRNFDLSNQFGVAFCELTDGFVIRGFADPIGYINRKEVCVRNKSIDRCYPDVIGIDEISVAPAQRSDGGISSLARGGRLRADDHMLAIGFIPNRNDFETLFFGQSASCQLRNRLMCKSVAHSDGIFIQS